MNLKVEATKRTDRIVRYLRSSINPRTLILGLVIVYFIVMAVRVQLWYQKYGQDPGTALPDYLLEVPMILILAAGLLVIRRWWSELLAVLVSARLLYVGYRGFLAVGFAGEVSPSTLTTLRLWLIKWYLSQPHEIFETGLALVIVCFSLVALSRRWLRGRSRPRYIGVNQSLTL